MPNLIGLKNVINVASNGLYADEYELQMEASFPEQCDGGLKRYLYEESGQKEGKEGLCWRVFSVSELPTRSTNLQETSLRGIPFVRRGRVNYSGDTTFTFLETQDSFVSSFIQCWFDVFEKDGSGAKGNIEKVMLNFTLRQYKPDRDKISAVRKLFYCLPVSFNFVEGGHTGERGQDIVKTTLTVKYTVGRSESGEKSGKQISLVD